MTSGAGGGALRAESLAQILKIWIKQGAVSLEVQVLATTLLQTCDRALGSPRLVIRKPGFYNNNTIATTILGEPIKC